VSEWAIQDSNL